MRCDLVLLGGGSGERSWELGRHLVSDPTPSSLARAIDELCTQPGAADLVLTWDAALGEPPTAEQLRSLSLERGDVWHAGLTLGQAGRPRLLDFVHPTWMLQADPRRDIEATSWRVSLRCCLARRSVWQQLGPPRGGYDDLDLAALELGNRWLWAGAVMRHAPRLLTSLVAPEPGRRSGDRIPAGRLTDETRFLAHRTGRRWAAWALLRAVATRCASPRSAWTAWRRLDGVGRGAEPPHYRPDPRRPATSTAEASTVTVLIPTVDRYPWLDVLLDQLRSQTRPPIEILVIDQTEPRRRRSDWSAFADLPLRVIERETPGQCSSRNAGLRAARGALILFLDDDDEIEADLIERHVAALASSGADASCGVADEVGSGPLPAAFRQRRVSDVFPTNNTMLRRAALAGSGLFDLAFETGARADADLGQRLYHSGALLILDPTIRVLHHHAPSGGLRRHKARAITYAESRRRIRVRHLPSITELYLARRHFTERQAREADVLRVAGTFALHGRGLGWRIVKCVWAALTLPDTLLRLRRARREAAKLLAAPRAIPRLDSEDGE